MNIRTCIVGMGFLLFVAGCGHQNPPEVVTLFDEFRKNERRSTEISLAQLKSIDVGEGLDKKLDEEHRRLIERRESIITEIIEIDPAAICPEWWGESLQDKIIPFRVASQQFRGQPLTDFRLWGLNRELKNLEN